MFPIYYGPTIWTLIWMLLIIIIMIGLVGILIGLVYWSINSRLESMRNRMMEEYLESLDRYLILKGFSAKKSKHKFSESDTLSRDDSI